MMPPGTDVTITAQQSGLSTWNLAITQYQAQLEGYCEYEIAL